MKTRIENKNRATQQAAVMAYADTLASDMLTTGAGSWSGDQGREQRTFLNAGLAVGVDAAIDARNWTLAIRLASALNLGR